MKYQATVTSVSDPEDWGRIKVSVNAFSTDNNVTPWCWPCVPMAGPKFGFFFMPEVGDEVWVEKAADGSWVWTGFFWTGRNVKPSDGVAPTVRVIRTPAGHQIKLDDKGDIEILHSNGNSVTLTANGDTNIVVNGDCNVNSTGKTVVDSEAIELNGLTGKIVTTECLCMFSGAPHPQGSLNVTAKGPF